MLYVAFALILLAYGPKLGAFIIFYIACFAVSAGLLLAALRKGVA